MALETENRQLDATRVGAGVRALLNDPTKGVYFVAACDGVLAGQLLITYEWSDWRNGDIWWLQSVFVHPDFRRLGVFRALFARLKEEALADPGVVGLRLYVEEQNTRAHETYRQLGLAEGGYFVMEQMHRRTV